MLRHKMLSPSLLRLNSVVPSLASRNRVFGGRRLPCTWCRNVRNIHILAINSKVQGISARVRKKEEKDEDVAEQDIAHDYEEKEDKEDDIVEGETVRNKGNYADMAEFLEEAFKDDREIQEILGDSVTDPEAMSKRVQERVKRKEKDILEAKTGSSSPMKVSFKGFDATDSYLWMELYNSPSEKEIDMIGSILRSWYLLGCLGGYNSLNMQLTRIPVNERLTYNENVEEEILPARFHNVGELEFQHNQGRLWVDMGTSDPLAIDVFINAFTAVSSDYVGIKEVTFGGKDFGKWDEEMSTEDDGYKSYRI